MRGAFTDYEICRDVRLGAVPVDEPYIRPKTVHERLRCAEQIERRTAWWRAFDRAQDRGLIATSGTCLTDKGNQFLDGIEPTACSGEHMQGASPVGDWRKARGLA